MKIILVIGLILLATGFVRLHAKESPDAAPAPTKVPADFKSLDTNGDGKISLAEFTAPAERFRAAQGSKSREREKQKPTDDASHGGITSPVDSIEGRYTPEVFEQLDINHDNFISPAELDALLHNAHNISQP